jgi:hypothetical protein
MYDFKNNNKVLFIPSWLDIGKRYGYKNSLDIWHKNIDINKNFNADFVIAHSVGALVALHNFKLHKICKIILVNPVISKRNILKRWYKYFKSEGLPNSFRKSIKIVYFFKSLNKLFKLFKIPAIDIINNISEKNLFIIYGEKDIYLFDKRIITNLNKKGFSIQKIEGLGHNYKTNIDKLIYKIIKSNI